MISAHQAKVLKLVSQAAIYVEHEGEEIRINIYDDIPDATGKMYFAGQGADSDDEYQIDFDDVDLNTSVFYRLDPIVMSDI